MSRTWDASYVKPPRTIPSETTIMVPLSATSITSQGIIDDDGEISIVSYPNWLGSPLIQRRVLFSDKSRTPKGMKRVGKMDHLGRQVHIYLYC